MLCVSVVDCVGKEDKYSIGVSCVSVVDCVGKEDKYSTGVSCVCRW